MNIIIAIPDELLNTISPDSFNSFFFLEILLSWLFFDCKHQKKACKRTSEFLVAWVIELLFGAANRSLFSELLIFQFDTKTDEFDSARDPSIQIRSIKAKSLNFSYLLFWKWRKFEKFWISRKFFFNNFYYFWENKSFLYFPKTPNYSLIL